jgi:hypothetical protein
MTRRVILTAFLVLPLFWSACGPREPPPYREEMDLTAAELNATPLAHRLFDEDQITLYADADPLYGEAPLRVRFRVQIVDIATGPRYLWNFGDGSVPSVEAHPKHTFDQPGHYTVLVRVIDEDNKVGVAQVDVAVFEPSR